MPFALKMSRYQWFGIRGEGISRRKTASAEAHGRVWRVKVKSTGSGVTLLGD